MTHRAVPVQSPVIVNHWFKGSFITAESVASVDYSNPPAQR